MASQYVGMDLYRRRSVIVRHDPDGRLLERVRIDNDPAELAAVIAHAGPDPEVVLEAMYGWYWAADALAEMGARVGLAHPRGVKAFAYRRVKNDERDAADLADLLRMGRLPEAWVAPPAVRQLRGVGPSPRQAGGVRSGLKAQVHAVLAKEGVRVDVADLFGKAGMRLLADAPLAHAYRLRVDSLLDLIDAFDYEVEFFRAQIADQLDGHPGYAAVQTIPGVGPTLGAVFVAEIGGIGRFPRPQRLCSWAGLTPRHHESDTTVRRGHITKQGSRLVRWATIEAIQRLPATCKLRVDQDRIAGRRGRNIGKVAAVRKLLTLVFYALRDGRVRCRGQMA